MFPFSKTGKYFQHIIQALFYLLIFFIFLVNSFNSLDPDLGWHLKVGEEIFSSHAIPWAENYNYTLEGRTWVDHEWLLNLVCYLIFVKFGYLTLNIFFALVATLIIFLINACFLKKYFADPAQSLLIIFFETFGLSGLLAHFGVRMQEFSVLALLLLLILLEKYSAKRFDKILFLVPLLFFAWANLHGGFMLGLFLYWLYFSFGLVSLWCKRFDFGSIRLANYSNTELSKLFLSASASTLAVFLTPYHYKYFSFMREYANSYYMKTIVEWLPAWHDPINYYQQLFFIMFATVLILLFINKKNAINGWHLLLSLILFGTAIKARRNFPLFFISVLPFLADSASVSAEESRKKIKMFFFENNFLKIILIIFLTGAIVVVCLSGNMTNKPFADKKFCQEFPCSALETIKRLPQDDLKIFNSYGWGGYLIWNWPERKLFIDGRLPMLIVNGHSLLEEYYEFFKEGKAKEKIDYYGINLVLIQKFKSDNANWFEKSFLGRKDKEAPKNHLEDYLNGQSDWQLLFEDGNAMVYYKK